MSAAGMFLTRRSVLSCLGLAAGSGAALALALDKSVKAELSLHPPKLPWPHCGAINSFDHSSIRRGYQVYKQVCSACHGLKYLKYRHFINVFMTEQEVKDEAAETMVTDGPNDTGEMYERQGKPFDKLPEPYPNDMAAAAANNGAAPPDLTFMAQARHGNEDYIYHLLTSYCDPPAGVELDEGQAFNPYFPGGKIGMPPPLYNEVIEYEDGTPATLSQLAKDVSTFLAWSASMEHDIRKKLWIKCTLVLIPITATLWYLNRKAWAPLKSRKLVYTPKKYPA